MKNLINNLKKMVTAPLLIIFHNILENSVHLLYNIHLDQIDKLYFSWVNNGSNNLNRERVELSMINFKILEENFYQF